MGDPWTYILGQVAHFFNGILSYLSHGREDKVLKNMIVNPLHCGMLFVLKHVRSG